LLVTGATGAVGTLLRPFLRERYDLLLTGRKPLEPAAGETYVRGDTADAGFVEEITTGVDGILHLAGAVAKGLSFEETLAPNYRSVLLLLEACRRKAIDRFIYASSHHIIGMLPSDRQWDETAPIIPDGFYGLSKAFGEAACAMYATKFGIRTLIVRIGNADPKIVDARRERIWISGEDLTTLVVEGMESPTLSLEVVNGVSNSDRPLLALKPSTQITYRPVSHSSGNRAEVFRSFDVLTEADGIGRVGGLFAASELPVTR
jgi:uronate dehydrogenase